MSRLLRSLTLAVWCGVSAASAAEALDDFERPQSGLTAIGVATVALVDAPADAPTAGDTPAGGKALELAWPAVHKGWVECFYPQPLAVPGLGPDTTVAIRLRAWLPADASVTSLSLRLMDKFHETFQFTAKLAPQPTAGWRTVVVPVDPAHPAGHWGGSNGGRLGFPLRLSGYSVAFANPQVPAGRVLFDQLRVAPLPGVALATDRFPSLVNASGAACCDLLLTNVEDRAISVTVGGALTTFAGATTPVSGTLELAPHASARLPLPLGDRQPGIRWFDYRLQLDGAELRGRLPFVIADPVPRAGGPGDFLFSICSHPEREPAAVQQQEMQAMAAAGATVARIGCVWATVEPTPGKWNWEVEDRLVDLAAQSGIETQPILGFPPAHAVSPELRAQQAAAYKAGKSDAWNITLCAPPEDAPWRAYVAAMTTRYRGRIRLYEVWNEPDLGSFRGTTDQYIALLRAAREEQQRADPAALLLSGGFATVLDHPGRARNPDLQERVLAEASDAFDIHAMHQHGPFDEFRRAIDGELRRIRARMTVPRPLYFNETAIAAYGDEKGQALTLVKKIAYVMAIGAIGHTWYDLRNDGDDPGNPEHTYGLLTRGFAPKPAFATYGEAVRQLHGLAPLGELRHGAEALAAGCEAHAFGGARGRVVVWWNEARDAPEQPVLLRLGAGAGAARAVDVMGAARDLPAVDGMVLAQATREPQYLDLPPGAAAPEVAAVLLRLAPATAAADPRLSAAAGTPLSLAAIIANPLARPLTVRLAWRDAAGQDAGATTTVAAGATAQVPVAFAAPPTGANVQALALRYAVDGTPWSGTLRQEVPVLRLLGTAAADGRAPDWVLDQSADVVQLCANDPALVALNWRGPADLSAKVWLWRAGDDLHLRVDVRDDVHVQREDAPGAWRGDGVQIAFQVPGPQPAAATGWWELGAASAMDGTVLRSLWRTPTGATATVADLGAECVPLPDGLRYDLTLPAARFGLSGALDQGFRFNLVVNDNDGDAREGFVRLAPGLGETKDPAQFPTVRFPSTAASR